MQFKAPRGTTDILPEERPYWRLLESTAERIAENFGSLRIDTPIFEDQWVSVQHYFAVFPKAMDSLQRLGVKVPLTK